MKNLFKLALAVLVVTLIFAGFIGCPGGGDDGDDPIEPQKKPPVNIEIKDANGDLVQTGINLTVEDEITLTVSADLATSYRWTASSGGRVTILEGADAATAKFKANTSGNATITAYAKNNDDEINKAITFTIGLKTGLILEVKRNGVAVTETIELERGNTIDDFVATPSIEGGGDASAAVVTWSVPVNTAIELRDPATGEMMATGPGTIEATATAKLANYSDAIKTITIYVKWSSLYAEEWSWNSEDDPIEQESLKPTDYFFSKGGPGVFIRTRDEVFSENGAIRLGGSPTNNAANPRFVVGLAADYLTQGTDTADSFTGDFDLTYTDSRRTKITIGFTNLTPAPDADRYCLRVFVNNNNISRANSGLGAPSAIQHWRKPNGTTDSSGLDNRDHWKFTKSQVTTDPDNPVSGTLEIFFPRQFEVKDFDGNVVGLVDECDLYDDNMDQLKAGFIAFHNQGGGSNGNGITITSIKIERVDLERKERWGEGEREVYDPNKYFVPEDEDEELGK